ncbi:MAG: ribonuclease D [Rickettsiales bacterium]
MSIEIISKNNNPSNNEFSVDLLKTIKPKISIFDHDIPDDFKLIGDIAFDTEAMGLKCRRDRLCLLQVADEQENIAIIKFHKNIQPAPNLRKIFEDKKRQKIAHFARFDVRIILEYLDIKTSNIFCTHIASSMARTYTNNHSLKDVCKDTLGILLSKQATFSDWGSSHLTDAQLEYAVSDVLYLHKIRDKLIEILKREEKIDIYNELTNCILTRAKLDIMGFDNVDLLSHHRDPNR